MTTVKRSELVDVFTQLGYPGCEKWNAKTLLARSQEVCRIAKEEEVDFGKHKQLFADLTKAFDEEEQVKVMNDKTKKTTTKAKAAKAKSTKKDSAEKNSKPGVVATCLEMLKAATKTSPVTFDQMHKKVCKLFPDKDPDSMMTTVKGMPYRATYYKGVAVYSDGNGGYYAHGTCEPGTSPKDLKSGTKAKKTTAKAKSSKSKTAKKTTRKRSTKQTATA